MRCKWRINMLILTIVLLLVFSLPQNLAEAQEGGPECPTGFYWDRLSGVGCIQENCLTIPNAKLSYTGSCICLEGYQPCTIPVDSTGVTCEPFCPAAELVTCVQPDTACPGEQPSEGAEADTTADSEIDPFEEILFDDELDDEAQEQFLSVLVRDLENFLSGGNQAGPTLSQAAVGAAGITALLTAWVISQLLAGTDKADVLQAISRWRQKDKSKLGSQQPSEQTEDTESATITEQAKTDAADAISQETKTSQAESPPQADSPPDLPTLRRKRMSEKLDAQQRIDLLKELQVLLDAEYRRVYADWEVARRCAPVEGVIDIADIWLGLRGKLGTSSVRGAYGKDLLKQAIKGAFRKLVRYRVDGTFELSSGALLEGAHSGLGVNLHRPGGALKQLLQNLVSGKGVVGIGKSQREFFKSYGQGISDIYGTGESILSVVGNARKDKNTCENLRSRMNEIRNLFNKTKSDLETAQTDLEIANSSVKAIDEDIKELKENFPNRFKDL